MQCSAEGRQGGAEGVNRRESAFGVVRVPILCSSSSPEGFRSHHANGKFLRTRIREGGPDVGIDGAAKAQSINIIPGDWVRSLEAQTTSGLQPDSGVFAKMPPQKAG